jgi:hypothetical protein
MSRSVAKLVLSVEQAEGVGARVRLANPSRRDLNCRGAPLAEALSVFWTLSSCWMNSVLRPLLDFPTTLTVDSKQF